MALLNDLHPEDVKAAIRKRYRSMAAFERAEGLSTGSVTEILRGRTSTRTRIAIERVLRDNGGKQAKSIILVDSRANPAPHRQNEGGE